jgi:DNA-binding MarR family transcriptional regulator
MMNAAMKDHVDRMLEQAGVHRSDSGSVEVISRLFRVLAFVERRLGEAYREADLTRGEVDVLYALLRTPDVPQSPGQVASALLCSSGAMTNRLDNLERAGFITRRHGIDDRRSVQLMITPEGRKAAEKATTAREAVVDEVLPGLTKTDRKTLVSLLRKMLVAFESNGSEA